jgi:NADP-dependent 3-hydroxy acid dehydrogenase YdfG
MFQVNIIGQSYLLSELSWLIKKNNTDLVFIWATIWYKWNEFMPMYSITKWWTRGLIENWRNELKNTKSRVIWIHPWWLNTESNIWENGRETIISNMTWKKVGNVIDVDSLSHLILNFFELPKNMEVSEVIINRK